MENLNGWQWFGIWLAVVVALAGWATFIWLCLHWLEKYRKERRLREAARILRGVEDLYKQDPREPFYDE